MFPPSSGGGGETPSLGLGKKTRAAMCLGLGAAEGWSPVSGRTLRADRTLERLRGWLPWSPPRQNPSPHAGSAADPAFARLGLGGRGEALVALTVGAAAADVGDLQL